MITILEGFLGSKVGRIIAEILLVLVLFFGYRAHVQHEAANQALAKLQTSSSQLVAKKNAEIVAEISAHAADVKANQEKTDATLTAVTLLAADRDSRVRDFNAYRRLHADVPRSSSGPAAALEGECGAQSCGDLASRLAAAGNDLAASAGALSAELESCQRDRDSLTGLPK